MLCKRTLETIQPFDNDIKRLKRSITTLTRFANLFKLLSKTMLTYSKPSIPTTS